MLNITGDTKLSSDEIKKKFKDYFGNELKLDLNDETDNCITYIGGGGYVTATIVTGKDKNTVDMVTREWEFQVKDFLSILK
ncbi:MAG: hypothetical protein JW864_11415 [Spirochaetes bacterium]|nr:hypothetical protein [Spirochaetota bacterium]